MLALAPPDAGEQKWCLAASEAGDQLVEYLAQQAQAPRALPRLCVSNYQFSGCPSRIRCQAATSAACSMPPCMVGAPRDISAPIMIRCSRRTVGQRTCGFWEIDEIKTVPHVPRSHPVWCNKAAEVGESAKQGRCRWLLPQ